MANPLKQAQDEIIILKKQLKEQEQKKGDFRNKMVARLQKIHTALKRDYPGGATEQEFIALAQKETGGLAESTAKKYIQLLKNCGNVHYKIVDLGHWETVAETLADGSTRRTPVMKGETRIGAGGQEVFKTAQKIIAGKRQPGEDVGEAELTKLGP